MYSIKITKVANYFLDSLFWYGFNFRYRAGFAVQKSLYSYEVPKKKRKVATLDVQTQCHERSLVTRICFLCSITANSVLVKRLNLANGAGLFSINFAAGCCENNSVNFLSFISRWITLIHILKPIYCKSSSCPGVYTKWVLIYFHKLINVQ